MVSSTVVTIGGGAPAEPQVESRAARIRRTGHAKHAAARNLSDRLAAATDYARKALAEANRSGVDARPAMEQAIALVMATGDALTAAIAGPGGAQ